MDKLERLFSLKSESDKDPFRTGESMTTEEWNRRLKDVLEMNVGDGTESGRILHKGLTNLLVDEETNAIPSTRISKEDMDKIQREYKRSFPSHEPDWTPDC